MFLGKDVEPEINHKKQNCLKDLRGLEIFQSGEVIRLVTYLVRDLIDKTCLEKMLKSSWRRAEQTFIICTTR